MQVPLTYKSHLVIYGRNVFWVLATKENPNIETQIQNSTVIFH